MPTVILPRTRLYRPAGEGESRRPRGCRAPDRLIEDGEAIEVAFERLAAAESNNAMKNAYLDMAAVYCRANKEVGRHWRDVRG